MISSILYIGQYQEGSTSRMRGLALKEIFSEADFSFIDTNVPFEAAGSIVRSIGFRYKIGPLIEKVNLYILGNLLKTAYDLIWVDKAIYISKDTTAALRIRTKNLIHFTPDPAFTFHKSKLFYSSLSSYDYAITTKSFEMTAYENSLNKDQVVFMYQGYHPATHKKTIDFKDRDKSLAFIGHAEVERETTLQHLLDHGVSIKVAGRKWKKFEERNSSNQCLEYQGQGLFGEDYVNALNQSQYSWGALSKWIPEQHTTRTFEIPACGAALISERTDEIQRIFSDDEAIFYESLDDLIEKIEWYNTHQDELETLANKGLVKVKSVGLDYKSQIEKFVLKVLDGAAR